MSQRPQKQKDEEASAKNDEAVGKDDAGKAAFETSKSRDDLLHEQVPSKGYALDFENGFADGPDGRGNAKNTLPDGNRDPNVDQDPTRLSSRPAARRVAGPSVRS